MVMTDEKLKEINLKPRTSREYLDLMFIIVNLEKYYREMKIDKRNSDIPVKCPMEKMIKKFLNEYKKWLL